MIKNSYDRCQRHWREPNRHTRQQNNGEVENVSQQAPLGSSTVGLVGYSNGIVRNSYSTADVTAQVSQAGGLIGITNSGDLTEDVYASGTIRAMTSNAGGVTGYGYNDTVIRNVIALSPSVTAPTMAKPGDGTSS